MPSSPRNPLFTNPLFTGAALRWWPERTHKEAPMADVQIQNGMVIRVPVTVIDARDRGNVHCLAGTTSILLDGAFLATSADVVAGPPPTPADQQTELLALVREKCPGFFILVDGQEKRVFEADHTPECQCDGTGYITCTGYWQKAPPGAFGGALIKAIANSGLRIDVTGDILVILLGLTTRGWDNCQAAAEATLEWVLSEEKAAL